MNSDMEIYYFLATNESHVTAVNSPLLDVLLSYPNIHVHYLNIYEFSKNTTVEKLFESNIIQTSRYRVEHMSDVLRILTLNKYGGVYLDLDVISLVPIRILNTKNFVCIETGTNLANGLLQLDKETGKKYSNAYLE